MDFKKKAITVAAFLACFNASVLAQNVKMHLNGVTVKTAMHTLKQQSYDAERVCQADFKRTECIVYD